MLWLMILLLFLICIPSCAYLNCYIESYRNVLRQRKDHEDEGKDDEEERGGGERGGGERGK
jgi:hypothetical protein